MYFGFMLLIASAGVQSGARNVAMFIVGRLILGFGTALIAQPSPIVITELAYPFHRARITAMYYSTYVSLVSSLNASVPSYPTLLQTG